MADATISQASLGLTLREFQVLDYVRSHRPRPVPFEEINDAIIGPYACRNWAYVYVKRIRQKLGPSVLVTHPGFGVRYNLAPVVEANPRCLYCGRAVARYEDEWVCHGCGKFGQRRRLEAHELEVGRAPGPGSRSGKPWTPEEEQFVLENRDRYGLKELGQMINRSASAIRGFSTTNGLERKQYRKSGEAAT